MNTTTLGLQSQQIGKTNVHPISSVTGTYGTQVRMQSIQPSKSAYIAPSAQNVSASTKSGNYPEKKFRAGGISATIWVNKAKQANGVEGEYKTVSLERSYTDKEGKWQSTQTLRVNDVPKAAAALQKAFEYLVLQEQDLFKGGR
ncbi:hypothetical protein HYX13_05765 [Candidatus Woesearchaeota archaeon]|nr:hypothetical protein [Candidatus Woesearchaeota archaeon]